MRLPPAARRVLYRTAIPLLRAYWRIARPHVTGTKFLITDGDRLLLVRHTYGPRDRWDIPGGWVRPGESPLHAARREAGEELGLSIERWRELGVVRGRSEHRHDTLHCFLAALDGRPLAVDPGEIAETGWFHRNALPTPLGRYVPQILELPGLGI